MKHRYLLAVALLLLPLAAHATYCNDRLVSIDDHLTRVLALCGEPTSVSRYVAYQTIQFAPGLISAVPRDHRGRHAGSRMVTVLPWQQTIAVEVEEWFFNFGPNRFTQRMTFVNGYLKRIDIESYGF
jgi:hypothetical protein